MKYQGRTFSLPASNQATEAEWDYTFASDKDFQKKHGLSKKTYEKLESIKVLRRSHKGA